MTARASPPGAVPTERVAIGGREDTARRRCAASAADCADALVAPADRGKLHPGPKRLPHDSVNDGFLFIQQVRRARSAHPAR